MMQIRRYRLIVKEHWFKIVNKVLISWFGLEFNYLLLRSGNLIKVRRLRLYELDAIPFDDPGVFQMVTVCAGGEIQRKDYDLAGWGNEQPEKPDKPESQCDPKSPDAESWNIYNQYHSALAMWREYLEARDEHAHAEMRYILENCISPGDQHKVTIDDWSEILEAALCPEVQGRDIEAALASTFQGVFWREEATPI